MIPNCAKIDWPSSVTGAMPGVFLFVFIFSQLTSSNCNRKMEPLKDPGNNDFFDDYPCLIVKSRIWSVYPVCPGSLQPNHLRTLNWSSITRRVAVESPRA